MRHELGHTLGFRHEHTRPDSGTCFEDNNWRPLTSYDVFSVMHYPQCNGQGDWLLTLTAIDSNGAACVYGTAPGFTIDPNICDGPEEIPGPIACGPKTETFADQQVAKNAWKASGPFPVTAGTLIEIVMHGETSPGDPDLYVRFDQDPATNAYVCRPYLTGAEETCSLESQLTCQQPMSAYEAIQPRIIPLRLLILHPLINSGNFIFFLERKAKAFLSKFPITLTFRCQKD